MSYIKLKKGVALGHLSKMASKTTEHNAGLVFGTMRHTMTNYESVIAAVSSTKHWGTFVAETSAFFLSLAPSNPAWARTVKVWTRSHRIDVRA